MALSPRRVRFVQEYCIDFNGTQAAIRAGYSEGSATKIASELLTFPEVAEAVAERKSEIAIATGLTPQWVLKQWAQIATADANEITQLRRICCRYCHGYGHQYQWTESEFAKALDQAIERNKPAPDGMGGFGFDMNADPHPTCPECGGLGVEYMHVEDTRKLKGSARRLYAGVQRTRDGLKIMTRDQDAALAGISKYLGMSVDKTELSGPNGGPLPIANLKADDLSDDQLAALIAGK